MKEIPMSTTPPTVVLVDPTSPDGQTALALVRDDDQHVIVVVLMSGRASNALHEFAHHEDTSVSNAAWIYLDQVAQRLERPGRIVGTVAAAGPDPAYELAMVAQENDAERVLLPSSLLRLDRHAPRRLAQLVPVVIEAAPALTTV
jgi:hypothetical protein